MTQMEFNCQPCVEPEDRLDLINILLYLSELRLCVRFASILQSYCITSKHTDAHTLLHERRPSIAVYGVVIYLCPVNSKVKYRQTLTYLCGKDGE